jgi:4-alpha-glucanotransferase
MQLPRASGILLHPTSLPGRYGIGDLGPEAHAFVDFLAEAGQTWWQVLPLGPVGYGGSPYQSPSSFAGNPLLISLDCLADLGWLVAREVAAIPDRPADRVDFDAASELKWTWLRRAFREFEAAGDDPAFEAFRQAHRSWLDDYVFYQALRDAHGGRPWYEWEPELVARRPEACARWRERVADGIRFHEFVQYAFETQWQELRAAGQARGIKFIGDVPIFVAHDSADVWAHPDLYYIDAHGRPEFMAGVPPDYFSEDGQLWGNPVYRWEAHAKDGFAWWLLRLRGLLERVDIIRIDHFRGFEAYWSVPAGSETAATGQWVPAPGREFFRAIRKELGSVPLIAEDLGLITPEVEALRDEFHLPGMRVLQFAFDADPALEKYLPHRYINNCIAYTGTHDNDTTSGWFHSKEVTATPPREEVEAARAFARRYANSDGREVHWDMIRIVFASAADTAIVPMQDVLGLDSRARMNFPGKPRGNWAWRYRAEQVDRRVTDRLAEMTALYGRWNGPVPAGRDLRPRQRAPAGSAPAGGGAERSEAKAAPAGSEPADAGASEESGKRGPDG